MAKENKQIWVIDNDTYFLSRLSIAAARIGWDIVQLDSADPSKLPDGEPELILLDRELSSNTKESQKLLKQWLQTLSEYKQRCYLITHDKEDEGRRLVADYELAGLKIKPLNVERIEDWAYRTHQKEKDTIDSSETQDGQHHWQEYIKAINVPTIVLDHDLHLVAKNRAARLAPIFSSVWPKVGATPNAEAQRMLNMMLHELEPPNQQKAATDCAIRCEWDARNKQWREWRLRSYPEKFAPGKYMLTFATYSKDAEHMMPLSGASHSSLTEYMDALAKHLAELWGITRLRLYRVEELVGRYAEDALEGHLLLPLLQFGGGLTTSKENWQDSAQLLSENQYTKKMPSAKETKLIVHDNSVAKGFPGVGFSKDTTRVNMLIRDTGGRLLGMISCDRRFDHFDPVANPEGAEREWQESDNRHARLAMQFVSDLGELSEDEAGRMQGLFNQVHDHLALILARLANERLGAWQRQITSIFTKRMDSLLRAEAVTGQHEHSMKALRQTFIELLSAWQRGQANLGSPDPFDESQGWQQPVITNHKNRTPPSQLDSMYIADFDISSGNFHSELGAGKVWSLRGTQCGQRVYWRAVVPQSQAVTCKDLSAFVLQDFQEFNINQRQNGHQIDKRSSNITFADSTPLGMFIAGLQRRGLENHKLERARTLLCDIGSWAAVKIPRAVGEPWLLVAVGKRKNSWTRERVRWLRVLAERMTMLLRWWQAESQREWYQASIAHELSKPMQLLESIIKNCAEEGNNAQLNKQLNKRLKAIQELAQYHQHLMDNIKTMADGGASYNSISKATTLREEWQLCEWARAYCSAVYFGNIREPLPDIQLHLPPSVLAQSMIIILTNAHRYHHLASDVKAKAELDVNNEQILFRVCNVVTKPIPKNRHKDIFLPLFKLPNSTVSSLGIGLAVLDAMRQRYGITCHVSDKVSDSTGWCWQIFELRIKRSKL